MISNKGFEFECAFPDSKIYGANMGPTLGRQDPGGPNVGPINFAICFFSLIYFEKVTIKSLI